MYHGNTLLSIFARKIRTWVTSSPDCIAYKMIDTIQTRPKMMSNTDFTLGPEDCLEVDILPNLPLSNGYKNNITMMGVFSRYLFACPTQDITAGNVGRCIMDVTTRHWYVPTVILTDKGSQFSSEVINQIAQTLDIRISHASTKHSSTNGTLEETHASLKTLLKSSTGERRSMWHKYVQIAAMNYNKSYHGSLGCKPTTVFHGRMQYNILDINIYTTQTLPVNTFVKMSTLSHSLEDEITPKFIDQEHYLEFFNSYDANSRKNSGQKTLS